MTKEQISLKISQKTGIPKVDVTVVLENLMDIIKDSIKSEENIYLRGFGTFTTKKRAKKIARNITKNTSLVVPEHNIPYFKPSKKFSNLLK